MTTKKNPVRATGLQQKAQLMSASEIERTLVRLAHQIWRKTAASTAWAWLESAAAASPLPNAWAR
jgi:hypothetical protein